jgi:hypothetical protein
MDNIRISNANGNGEARFKARKRERIIRAGAFMTRLRLSEVKRLVRHRRENGEAATLGGDKAIFAVALPQMVKLPSKPSKWGEPGPGDIVAFAIEFCPVYFLSMGGHRYFERMAADYADPRNGKPRPLKAATAGNRLQLTSVERATLKIRTIALVSREEAKAERRRKDAAYQASKRHASGATPHSQSLSQTRPWEAFGWSRRTWYRRGKPELGTNSSAQNGTVKSADDTTSSAIGTGGTSKPPIADAIVPRGFPWHPAGPSNGLAVCKTRSPEGLPLMREARS